MSTSSVSFKTSEPYVAASMKLYQLVKKIMSQAAQLDTRIPYHAILAYFSVRAARIHWAITRLCREGSGPEALILLRSFLNLLIDLRYISDDLDTRSRRYLRYGELVRAEGWDVYKRWYIEGPFASTRNQARQERQRKLDQELVGHHLLLTKEFPNWKRLGWADCTIRERAKRVGEEYAYDSVYRIGSAMDHGSPSGSRYFMRDKGGEFLGRLGPIADLVPQVLVSSCDYLYKVMQLWCAEFNPNAQDSLLEWNREAASSFASPRKRAAVRAKKSVL